MLDHDKILKQIQEESQQIIIPDVRNQVKARYLAEQPKSRAARNLLFRRPLVQIFTSIVLILLLVIGLSQPHPSPQTITLTQQEKEDFLLQSITGATLLLTEEETQVSYQPLILTSLSTEQEETSIIHDFILSIEQLVSLNEISSITTSSFSPLPNYTYKEVISFTTLFLQTFVYSIHYNIAKSTEEHIIYTISGILLIEENTFVLSGYKEISNEEAIYHLDLEQSPQNIIHMQLLQNEDTVVYQFAFAKNQVAQVIQFYKNQDTINPGFHMLFKRGNTEISYFVSKETEENKISMQGKNNAHDIIVEMRRNNNSPVYEYFFPGSGNAIPMKPKHPHGDNHPGRRPTNIV